MQAGQAGQAGHSDHSKEAGRSQARLALITAPDQDTARALALALVEARLAACVNLLPGVTSLYRWQGAVESASEVLLLVKTTAGRIGAIEALLARQHPYEVPELVAFEPAHVEPKYRRWLEEACTGS